jgi:hypothetical protein
MKRTGYFAILLESGYKRSGRHFLYNIISSLSSVFGVEINGARHAY